MQYLIRKIEKREYKLLEDFLYEAIFIPEGVEPPERNVIELPELQLYYKNFGQKDDTCLVAEVEGRVVGAVWCRIMNDYGHVDEETPSLAISLYKEYRGMGIGTAMLQDMLALLRKKGYKRVSLSVEKRNFAYKMYLKAGFHVVDENKDDYIMVCEL